MVSSAVHHPHLNTHIPTSFVAFRGEKQCHQRGGHRSRPEGERGSRHCGHTGQQGAGWAGATVAPFVDRKQTPAGRSRPLPVGTQASLVGAELSQVWVTVPTLQAHGLRKVTL